MQLARMRSAFPPGPAFKKACSCASGLQPVMGLIMQEKKEAIKFKLPPELLWRCSRYSPAEGAASESLPGSWAAVLLHTVFFCSSMQVDVNGPVSFILLVREPVYLHLRYKFRITSGACMRFYRAF